MKIAFTQLFLMISSIIKVQAQDNIYGPTISYQYQNGSVLKTGLYYATKITSKNFFKIDATANSTWTQKKYALIPELALTYYSDIYYFGLLGRAELTPYTFSPKVGFTFMTLLELDFGYGIPINEKTDYRPIKGFNTSLRLNLPLNKH